MKRQCTICPIFARIWIPSRPAGDARLRPERRRVPRARRAPQGGGDRVRATEGAAQRRERRDQQAAQAGRRYRRAAAEGARDRRAHLRRSTSRSRRSTSSSASCWRASPTCRTSRFPSGRSEADNVEVRRWGQPPPVRLRAQGALGPRPGAGHPGLRAGGEDHRRALRRVLGPGREARAGADQLHARRAHARARLHRSAAAVHGQLGQPVRHRPVAEVRRGPVQVRGHRFLAHADGRSAGDEPVTATRRSTPTGCPSSCAPTRRASAARPAPTARTCAASSASTSSRKWNW